MMVGFEQGRGEGSDWRRGRERERETGYPAQQENTHTPQSQKDRRHGTPQHNNRRAGSVAGVTKALSTSLTDTTVEERARGPPSWSKGPQRCAPTCTMTFISLYLDYRPDPRPTKKKIRLHPPSSPCTNQPTNQQDKNAQKDPCKSKPPALANLKKDPFFKIRDHAISVRDIQTLRLGSDGLMSKPRGRFL